MFLQLTTPILLALKRRHIDPFYSICSGHYLSQMAGDNVVYSTTFLTNQTNWRYKLADDFNIYGRIVTLYKKLTFT